MWINFKFVHMTDVEKSEIFFVLPFSFSFNIGPNFSFSVDTRGKEVSTPQKKKKTPSTLRRDARRREEFLRKKLNAPTAEKAFMCDHCDNTFKSENGLKIHIGKSHKKVDSTPATPDRLRQQTNGFVSLSASPCFQELSYKCGINTSGVFKPLLLNFII